MCWGDSVGFWSFSLFQTGIIFCCWKQRPTKFNQNKLKKWPNNSNSQLPIHRTMKASPSFSRYFPCSNRAQRRQFDFLQTWINFMCCWRPWWEAWWWWWLPLDDPRRIACWPNIKSLSLWMKRRWLKHMQVFGMKEPLVSKYQRLGLDTNNVKLEFSTTNTLPYPIL